MADEAVKAPDASLIALCREIEETEERRKRIVLMERELAGAESSLPEQDGAVAAVRSYAAALLRDVRAKIEAAAMEPAATLQGIDAKAAMVLTVMSDDCLGHVLARSLAVDVCLHAMDVASARNEPVADVGRPVPAAVQSRMVH